MKKSIFTLLLLVVNINLCLLAANMNDDHYHENNFDSDTSKLRVAVNKIQNSERAIVVNIQKIDSIVIENKGLTYHELKPIFDSLCRIESDVVYKYVLKNIDLNKINIGGTDIFGSDNYVIREALLDAYQKYDDKLLYKYFDFLLKSDILENELSKEVLELYASLYLPSKYGAFDIIHYTHGSEQKAENLQRIIDIVTRK